MRDFMTVFPRRLTLQAKVQKVPLQSLSRYLDSTQRDTHTQAQPEQELIGANRNTCGH
jgi:hypothetical protein